MLYAGEERETTKGVMPCAYACARLRESCIARKRAQRIIVSGSARVDSKRMQRTRAAHAMTPRKRGGISPFAHLNANYESRKRDR